jgi:hypothetical protein
MTICHYCKLPTLSGNHFAPDLVRGGRKKLGFEVWLCSWQSLTVHILFSFG